MRQLRRWRLVTIGVGMRGGWRRQVVATCAAAVLPCHWWWWWFALQVFEVSRWLLLLGAAVRSRTTRREARRHFGSCTGAA